MIAITFIIDVVARVFTSFSYRWLTREMNCNLPKELDFREEAKNAERFPYFIFQNAKLIT